jgi:hypothetical protein
MRLDRIKSSSRRGRMGDGESCKKIVEGWSWEEGEKGRRREGEFVRKGNEASVV